MPPKRNKKAKAMINPMIHSIKVPLAQFCLWIFEPSLKAQTSNMMIPIIGSEEMKIVSAHSLASRGLLSANVSIKLVFEFKFHV